MASPSRSPKAQTAPMPAINAISAANSKLAGSATPERAGTGPPWVAPRFFLVGLTRGKASNPGAQHSATAASPRNTPR